MCLQKLHVQNHAGGRRPSPTEPGSPLAWGSGRSREALQGLIDSDLADKVLRALEVELGLNRADELPELWLDHHALNSPSALLSGY